VEINYQWENLSVMFGQLGEAATQLGGCGIPDSNDMAYAVAAPQKETVPTGAKVIPLTLPESV